MPVVSDTSPILNLAIIGQLKYLRQQFDQIWIPKAVLDELQVESDLPGTEAIRDGIAAGWLLIVHLNDNRVALALQRDLDNGESEAIALALQTGIKTILMDEHDGREAARAMGLRPIGILGVLLRAKISGHLESVESVLQALKNDAGFFIDRRLYQKILDAAGER